jgi:hypothetical protein
MSTSHHTPEEDSNMGTRLSPDVVSEGERVPPVSQKRHTPLAHTLAHTGTLRHNAELLAQNDAIRRTLAQTDTLVAQTVPRIEHNLAQMDALLAASEDLLANARPNLNTTTTTKE